MSTNQSGTNSTPAPTAGAANQPVSPATPTVGTTVGTPANATAQPGDTFASLKFAVTTLFQASLDSPFMLALRCDGSNCLMDLLSSEDEVRELKYDAPIINEHGADTGRTELVQLERPHRGTSRALLGNAYLRETVHRDPITPINCMNMDVQAFLNYQCSGDFIMETNPDSHLATVRNKFAPKHGELQRPMSDKSDRQATVDVISNQYSDTTSPTTIVSSALKPSIRMSDGVNILNGSRATQLVGAQNTMSRPTLNKRDIANDGKGERPFERVGILKSSKTISTLNEASEDETLDQLDDFDTAMDLNDTGIGNATLVTNLDWDQTLLDPHSGNLGRSVSADSTSHGLLLQLPEASMGSDSDALLPEQDETDEYPMDLENGEQQCVISDKLAVVPATKRPPPTPQQEAKQHEFTVRSRTAGGRELKIFYLLLESEGVLLKFRVGLICVLFDAAASHSNSGL
ncbi:unnamed protein product, partial [Cylindrotheca closterium]